MLRVWGALAVVLLAGCSVDVDRFLADRSGSTGSGGGSGAGGQSSMGNCTEGTQTFADTFERDMTDGWGTAAPGPGDYAASSTTTEPLSVAAGRGRIDTNFQGQVRAIVTPNVTANESLATVYFTQIGGAGSVFASVGLFGGQDDRWELRLTYRPVNDDVTLALYQISPNFVPSVIGQAEVLDTSPEVSVGYRIRFRADPMTARLRAMAWRTDGSAPGDWLLDQTATRAAGGSMSSFGGGGIDLPPTSNPVQFEEVALCDVR